MIVREILYRAWDDVKDTMYYAGEEADVVFELTGVGIKATVITEDVEEFRTLHHLKYMQYTGLKDKHGTDIFEGDIVSFISKEKTGEKRVSKRRGYDTYSVYSEIEIRGVVSFGEVEIGLYKKVPGFFVDTNQSVTYETYFFGSGKKSDRPEERTKSLIKPLLTKAEYEVIGTIWEHPHLLEGRDEA
ncbi:YopX family protein [Paenibacillus illinoisensis]|uniref:YopX family protein n=1 Tax=Paenibacillus illinoisensis TaxID=59845 RepID=UPI00301B8F29